MPLSSRQLTQALKQVLAIARSFEPTAQVFVALDSASQAHVRFSRNEATTSGEIDQGHLAVTVQLGQRAATSTSNQTDEASMRALVERTVRLARLAPEDPELMPVLGPQAAATNTAAFDAAIERLDAKGRAELVRAALEPGREQQLATAGFLATWSGLVGKASSAGLLHIHPATSAQLSVTARTSAGTGSGRGQFHARRLAGLSARSVAERACATARASEGPRRLEPGRYTVVLEPAASASLAQSLLEAMDQRAADEGRSFFAGKVGTKPFADVVSITSDPRQARTPMLPFDGEGRVLAAQPWVSKGTVSALSTSRYWAKKTGKAPIGGHGGFELAAGSVPRSKLIEGVKRGVLISRFWYTNWVEAQTLLLTGLTRDGTFLIENGELVGPVNNFRFNQSVADAFARCDALGDVVEAANDAETVTPAMRTHDFLLASVSEAV
jgi:predicted Zn-dependent protease